MKGVSVFINLDDEAGDNESKFRLKIFRDVLKPNTIKKINFGKGDFPQQSGHKPGVNYESVVEDLLADNPTEKAYFSPCWPSADLFDKNAPGKPIVFGGVVAV